jgi:preflagellin peptidase FlaK
VFNSKRFNIIENDPLSASVSLVQIETQIELTKTMIALLFLFYTSLSDYRTREVSDTVWAVMGPLGLALTLIEMYITGFSQLPLYGICFGLTSAFAIAIFYAGGFGGADAKALMCLALMLPFYPVGLPEPLLKEISPISANFFPLSIFNNSVLLAALMAIVMLLYNVSWRLKTGNRLFGGAYDNESVGRKIVILLTGYKTSVGKMKDKWHIYPLEDVEENAEKQICRKLLVVPKDEGRDAVVKRLDEEVKEGKISDRVWVTPGLPFLIFVTIGLILALFVGDLVWTGIRLVLG